MSLGSCRDLTDKLFHGLSMGTCNLALVAYDRHILRLEGREIPTPGENEVLVEIKSVMLCHSDLDYLTSSDISESSPVVPGRDASGLVKQVGSGVTHLKKGDRVSILYFGEKPTDKGLLCRFQVLNADHCYKLPNHVSFDAGALLVPLAIALYACKRVGITKGSNVLIWGAEAIGLAVLLVAKSMEAERVAVADLNEERLKLAESLGADGVFHIKSSDEEQETLEEMKNTFFRELRVVECPILNQVDVHEVYRYSDCFERAVEFISSGKIDIGNLITEKVLLEQAHNAFELLENSQNAVGKILVLC